MSTRALEAVLFREAKIRATNWTFIFWDLLYPLGYLLVFGLGVNASLGFTSGLASLDYHAFFLAGVLGMGEARTIAIEGAAFIAFTAVAFALAVRALEREC
jgi:hypothetical protein